MDQPPRPERLVHYQICSDALGAYIAFSLNATILPEDIPPHALPAGAELRQVQVQFHFGSRDQSIGSHELRRLFLEFAKALGWHLVLDP
jgi:hypothetical protein